MSGELRISRANARFQQWQALLGNRSKRQRAGEFLVQGVRPISLAVELGWPVRALIYDADRPLSQWAVQTLQAAGGERVAMAPELLRELGGKDDDVPELVAVVELPGDDLSRIEVGPSFLGVVFDRPNSPGNVGTMARSLDAFGGAGLIVTGHAADPYDPRSVRASTGSLLALPVVRTHSHREVLEWAARLRARGLPLTVVGTDEHGADDIADLDLTGPTLLVVGNETTGLSAGWRQGCDTMARIPITGSASSLNAANAATVVLYEAARQRNRRAAGA
ncbi:TrmH family RNA methyltransferase [Nonomuraea candida]|uniref:TrmH family RNA methyltransferase n=1 Tax=Nonomuraea candida TaxID=359159 RepID=UPI0005B86CF9|nr:TrmH family RNA methyltransferase [Nonomuraea candida]